MKQSKFIYRRSGMITIAIPAILLGIILIWCVVWRETPAANLPEVSYRVESIALPEGLSGENGALSFFPDGRLVAAFRRGEVMTYNPETKEWAMFANGLHDPLGLLVVDNSEILVMQYPELTRVKDTDGDRVADVYETVTDDFGFSGNYHEFNYGPVKDRHGNLFIGLNSTSNGGKMMKEVRGAINERGRRDEGMYSAVPYRGWVMKLTPEGVLEPYACGFRSPNGLGFDAEGHLLVTDNQGDWVGTSALYQVEEGHFYGHPPSLVWRNGWDKGPPHQLPVAVLDSMRSKAAVLFPHGIMANSPSQPIRDATGGEFGPFEEQIFVGEMNRERIVRVVLEEVGGQLQGACIPFLDGQGLRKGNNRLAFAPDGSLWVGQNAHGWAGASGIQRIVYTGRKPMDIYTVHLTKDGFELTFTQALDKKMAATPGNYEITSYYYEYHAKYGSDRFDVKPIKVKEVQVSGGGKKVSLALDPLEEGRVYEMRLNHLSGVSGDTLANNLVCYTVNKLKK